jgi:hypothetical protein
MPYLHEIEVAKQQFEQIRHDQQAYRKTEKCRLLSPAASLVAMYTTVVAPAQTTSTRRETADG